MPDIGIFVDFGSTYTKVAAIDLDQERIMGQGRALSTVTTDITVGLKTALEVIEGNNRGRLIDNASLSLACSSAAGGLQLVVVGLVPALSLKAGKLAALGAGAKLVGNYSYKLNQSEVKRIEQSAPDIILLVGGTDGGNEEVILHNGKMIAESRIAAPVVVAGNKACADDIRSVLELNGKYVKVVDNVLSGLDHLNVQPSRAAIREIFMERIVHAKGLDKANELVDGVVMPTPMAVLKAAELLSLGAGDEPGLGELIVVDIGGATTDVHSIAHGHPRDQGVIMRGIHDPFAKRTVEGDLGMRYNALSVLEAAGPDRIRKDRMTSKLLGDLEERVTYLSEHINAVPKNEADYFLDAWLGRIASEVAVERHAGRLEHLYTPQGPILMQSGKDLTEVKNVIGVGGAFAYGRDPLMILEGALFSEADPLSLKPRSPDFFVDERYLLYAVGLLAEKAPDKALRIGKKYVRKITVTGGES